MNTVKYFLQRKLIGNILNTFSEKGGLQACKRGKKIHFICS